MIMDTEDQHSVEDVKFWFSKRFLVAILMFFGTINTYSLSANLNIAIVEMTSTKTVTINDEVVTQGPEFDWDSKTKGLIISAFAYGLSLSIFGGYLAMRFGGSLIISTGVAITAIITILNPFIIEYNFLLFLVARAVEGVVEGFAIVSFTELWTKWAPAQDRSRLMSIGYSGMYTGTALAYPICGFVMQEYGWPSAFYLTGGAALLWSVIWFLLVPNSPSQDRWISKEELKYITENQEHGERPNNVLSLCQSMIKSKHVLALCITKFTYGVGFTIVVTCFPMYIKDVTDAEIGTVGIFSSLPNIISAFTVPVVGMMVDCFQNRKIMTITQIHKTFMSGAFIIGAILLLIISYFSTSFTITMICFMIFKIALSTNYVITQLCCIALAPKCSGVVYGFLVIFNTLSSIITPVVIGYIVTERSKAQWDTCFSLSAAALIVGAITYLFYGSSEPQPWSYAAEEEEMDKHDLTNERA